MASCQVNDCESSAFGRGFCVKHYRRWQRHGDANVVVKNTRPGYVTPERRAPKKRAPKAELSEYERDQDAGMARWAAQARQVWLKSVEA
jgi:hypothetical protein